MLKDIDPLAGPALLRTRLGHGDEISIAEANFPATVLSVMPLGEFRADASFQVGVVRNPPAD
jgi:L-fucose mutarotase/ribose pyranase (RbsD/FucU family)